jgi:acetyl-CoA acyltransferase 1
MSVQHLKIPFEKVNPVGGAIALGHPLGCTGARQVATAMSQAKREKSKIFVTSMCIGSGMVSDSSHPYGTVLTAAWKGMAAVFVNEQ